MRIACLPILACTLAAIANAAPPANLVQAELLADVATIKPGQPFTAAVRFRIQPGWHIYWKYPGDSGLPTRIAWKLPMGFVAGELQFPIPQRIVAPGDLVNYGYEDEVLLLAQITPPSNLTPGATIDLAAGASWLACEKVCIPGKISLKLSVLVDDAAPPASADLFAKWKQKLPKTLTHDDTTVATDFGFKPGDANAPHSAFIQWTKPPAQVQWFPAPPTGSGMEEFAAKDEAGRSVLTFKLAPPPKESKPMTFVAAYTDGSGKRQGVEFTVDLPPADK